MSKEFSFLDLDKALSKISGFEAGSILETNAFSQTDEWIGTGNYLLNAQLSGSLFGGIANNRSVGVAGDPGTGKSFLCQNIVREAQKIGYNVIYCDTEGAIDKKGALKFGIDPNKIRYQPIKTVSDFKIFTANLINLVQESKKKGSTLKVLLVLDSLGMLTTQKEIDDALKGKSAMDMGIRAKEMRSLFRLITLDLTSAKIPLICTNHTTTGGIGGYMTTKESSGGDGPIFSMSNLIMLSKSVLKDNNDTKTGIIVTSNIKKARFTVPHQVKFHISWLQGMNPYVGLQDFVSWESCGIQRGKLEKGEFTPVESSPRWAVRHLGKTIPSTQLFSPEVFTEEVLRELDEKVIRKHFELPDLIEESEFEEIINSSSDKEKDTQEKDTQEKELESNV